MFGMSILVNLTKRVLIESGARSGLRYCPVVFAKNGRVKPDVVLPGANSLLVRKSFRATATRAQAIRFSSVRYGPAPEFALIVSHEFPAWTKCLLRSIPLKSPKTS